MVLPAMFDRARAIAFLSVKLRETVVSRRVLGVQRNYAYQRLDRVLPIIPTLFQLRQLKMRGPKIGIDLDGLTKQRICFRAGQSRIRSQRAR